MQLQLHELRGRLSVEKLRLDKYLCACGMFEIREKAKMAIESGVIFVDGKKADKPSLTVDENAKVEIRGETLRYVSRGGLKLEKAIDVFGVVLEGAVAADIGSSTGGFTDCMLQNGAMHVYSIDVGRNQLAEKLRRDSRVTVMENTDIRSVRPEMLEPQPNFVSVDVSFISLSLVLPTVFALLAEDGTAVVLVKPQFEAGKGRVGKNGVVRDPRVHEAVLRTFVSAAEGVGFAVKALDFSPIRGPEGNIEYIALLDKTGVSTQVDINRVVRASHDSL